MWSCTSMVWSGKSWLENAALAQPEPREPQQPPNTHRASLGSFQPSALLPPGSFQEFFSSHPGTLWPFTGHGSLDSQGMPLEGKEMEAEMTPILLFSCTWTAHVGLGP